MAPPKKLSENNGVIIGANVTHNDPFPCPNGNPGGMTVPGGVNGVIQHTMVGDLPGTVSWFNNRAASASAHFGVGQGGEIHQFGSVRGWESWAQAGGNSGYYSIEFADHGNPSNPLTQAQVDAGAQLLEVLSRVGNFPLQVADSPGQEGFGWHGMGGAAWGGHYDCPGNARKAQRPAIIALAKKIRAGSVAPPPPLPGQRTWTTKGMLSLNALAHQLGISPARVLELTAAHSPGAQLPPAVAAYVNEVFAQSTVLVPAGAVLHY